MFCSTSTNHIRLMVVGESKVGKSALVVKYLTGRFIYEYQSDFDWKYAYQTEIDNEQVHMEIIDSLTMDDAHIRWAEGFLIVYDVTRQDSLKRAEKLKKHIEIIRATRTVPLVIVGNKVDLSHSREVKVVQADDFSRKLSAHHFACSACGTEIQIRRAFDQLCREVAQFRLHSAQKRERRRSSLSQVRQSLKMLVHTGKARSSTASTPNSENNSPNTSGRNSGSKRRFGSPSPYSSLMSAPVLNDVPEDAREMNGFFEVFNQDHDVKLPQEPSLDKDENKKGSQQRNVIGAIVL